MTSLKKVLLTATAAAVALSSAHAFEINGRGASFPAPVYKSWATAYYKATGNKVNYTASGSGDGIKSIEKRLVDFAGSDKPLKPKLLRKHKLYMYPAIVGSIVLAYNLPGVADNQLKLSEKAIAAIFSGKAKYWDDAVIVKDNKEVKLPHQPINVCVRADGSGTTFNFTYYLSKIDPADFKPRKKLNWKANVIGGKGNQGVTANIQNNKYSIGYIEYSYKLKSGLPAATVENREHHWVKPTVKSFQDAAKYASWDKKNDFYAVIAYPKGATSYPIVAASFILLDKEKTDTNKKVTAFYDWAFHNGQKIAADLGYVALPEATVKEIKAYWNEKEIAPVK
ncbi:phosphate ABC transporter substrate-binding protein PstS [Nitratifractor sp.]|uniref:phosphate ABC transporter substrate-binding protein PstS n=1 Tax=Nitratifractor sp. TaxID=2268144 RepID=UPI0025FEE2C3|nr:phosphate ABC transporter substrate-binding protein PstS [Nitratifractor sp.]